VEPSVEQFISSLSAHISSSGLLAPHADFILSSAFIWFIVFNCCLLGCVIHIIVALSSVIYSAVQLFGQRRRFKRVPADLDLNSNLHR